MPNRLQLTKKIKRDIEENPYSRVKIYNLVEESVAILNEHFIGKYINDIHPQVNITPLPDGTYKLLPQYDMPSLLFCYVVAVLSTYNGIFEWRIS
jgi:hypothetical protein